MRLPLGRLLVTDRYLLEKCTFGDLCKGDRMVIDTRYESMIVAVVAEIEDGSYERKPIEGGGEVAYRVVYLVEPPDDGEKEWVRIYNRRPEETAFRVVADG